MNMERNMQTFLALQVVQSGTDLFDWFVATIKCATQDGDNANGILVAELDCFFGIQMIAMGLDRNKAWLNLPVASKFVPADLDIGSHHQIWFVSWFALCSHALTPAPIHGHAAQHRSLARTKRGRSHSLL